MAIVNYKCNDGTFENRDTDYQGRQDVPCRRNGGVQNQNAQTVTEELQTKKQESILGKISGAYGKNLIIAVVLIAGYFAYKKFKK